MDITITISEKVEQNIREKAEERGKAVEEFVEEFVEKSFEGDDQNSHQRKHNLLAFAGKYSSGKTDTSERMKEILYETDFDPVEGFSKR